LEIFTVWLRADRMMCFKHKYAETSDRMYEYRNRTGYVALLCLITWKTKAYMIFRCRCNVLCFIYIIFVRDIIPPP